MKGDKRRIKKIVTGLVILVLLGITLSGVRIRSVGQYKQEQKQLANDLFATPDKTQTDNGTVSETEPPDEVGASEHREERQRQNRGNRRQSLKR